MKTKKLTLIILTVLLSLVFLLGFLPNILQASRFYQNTKGISKDYVISATVTDKISAYDEENREYYYLKYTFISEIDGVEYKGMTVKAYNADAVKDQSYIDIYYNAQGDSYEASYMLSSEMNYAYLAIPVVALIGLSLSVYYLVKLLKRTKT